MKKVIAILKAIPLNAFRFGVLPILISTLAHGADPALFRQAGYDPKADLSQDRFPVRLSRSVGQVASVRWLEDPTPYICTGVEPPLVSLSGNFTPTYTRASAASCELANGSLVYLTSDQPVIEADGARGNPAATNTALWSEDFGNAVWTTSGTITVTTNTYAAPDGTTTMDTVQGSTNGAYIAQNFTTSSPYFNACSIWVRTVSGTQSIRVMIYNNTGGNVDDYRDYTATTTPYRVKVPAVDGPGQNLTLRIYPGNTGGTGTIALWGSQCEANSVTSYIPTGAVAVSRAAEDTRVTNAAYLVDWPKNAGVVAGTWTKGTDNFNAGYAAGFMLAEIRDGVTAGWSAEFSAIGLGNAAGFSARESAVSFDRTLDTSGTTGFTGGSMRLRIEWNDDYNAFWKDGVLKSSSTNTKIPPSVITYNSLWFPSTTSSSGAAPNLGWMKNVCVADYGSTACL